MPDIGIAEPEEACLETDPHTRPFTLHLPTRMLEQFEAEARSRGASVGSIIRQRLVGLTLKQAMQQRQLEQRLKASERKLAELRTSLNRAETLLLHYSFLLNKQGVKPEDDGAISTPS